MESSDKLQELFLDESEEIRKELGIILVLNNVAGEAGARIILARLAGTRCIEEQNAQAESLAKWGPAILPFLVLLLKDKNEHLRNGAIKSLQEMGSTAVDSLVEALDSNSELIRYGAIMALGAIGHRKGLERLIHALTDANRDCRQAAAWALGKLRANTAVDALVGRLKEGEDSGVRIAAIVALGQIGDARKSAEPLSELLNDNSKDVRNAAKAALERMREIKRFYSTLKD